MTDTTPFSNRTIVLGVCGSVAAFKALELASRLVQLGATVPVIMTTSAQEFIQPLSFEALTHETVYTGMFVDHTVEPWHIALAEKCDLLLIAPATANIIGKMANGLADDLLSCTAMATRAPVIIAPAMNDGMYTHPATQKNIATLKERNVSFVGPAEGRLASGKIGTGRLCQLSEIIALVTDNLREDCQ